MKNRIIIFDFDGVIVNSIQLSLEINREMMADIELDDLRDWAEGNIYDTKLRGQDVGIEVTSFYFERYGQKIIELVPVEGMEEIFEKIKSWGYKMMIVSSTTESSIENFLKKYDLKKYFIEILAKNTHVSKVEKFKMIFKKYKIRANQALMVTDTVGDVKEAQSVKIKTIGTSWGLHEPERLEKNGVDFIAKEPRDILKGIEKMIKFTT